jgi:segregation and condensation protein B
MHHDTQSEPGFPPESVATTENGDSSSLRRSVEAVLLTLEKPVTPGKLAEGLGVGVDQGGTKAVSAAIDGLNEEYERTGRAFRIEKVAGGVRIMTLPEFADDVAKFHQARQSQKLSRAALETLAVIAYRQPVTRASLEAIRGVACGEVLRTLVERRMVTITGRAEELGRPMLYGTTKQFLELFGLSTLKDLPSVEDGAFTALLEAKPFPADEAPESATDGADDADVASEIVDEQGVGDETAQETLS